MGSDSLYSVAPSSLMAIVPDAKLPYLSRYESVYCNGMPMTVPLGCVTVMLGGLYRLKLCVFDHGP